VKKRISERKREVTNHQLHISYFLSMYSFPYISLVHSLMCIPRPRVLTVITNLVSSFDDMVFSFRIITEDSGENKGEFLSAHCLNIEGIVYRRKVEAGA
jgi:hypothetical protein